MHAKSVKEVNSATTDITAMSVQIVQLCTRIIDRLDHMLLVIDKANKEMEYYNKGGK
jgi:hypothetical protein